MLFEVTHTTQYRYEAPVSQCLNEVRLTPRALTAQRVRTSAIRVDPIPAFLRQRKDYFGNDVSVFAVFERHDQLTATSQSVVEVTAREPEKSGGPTWESVRDALRYQENPSSMEASEFVYNSPYVPNFPQLETYARKTFTPGKPLIEAAMELSRRIHAEFAYEPKSTAIDSPLQEVLKKRRGVCQDFSHIMIGALRSQRLAARYVSGYVRSGARFVGAQASHAWVSVFVPGSGWIDFDPTNDMMPSDSHITLAWGRDYGDVTPVKGVTLGGGGQVIEVEVYVRAVS